MLARLEKEFQGHEYIETNDFQKLGCDSILVRFLSFHWIKFLKQFPKQLETYNSEVLYHPVSPSEKIALILLKLQDATIQVSTKEFTSFIQNLFQFHNFKSELLNLDDIPKVSSSEIKQDAEIGRGGFGVIYRGVWEGMDVAIKQLHLENLSNDLLQEFINEAKIMHKCRHPNIVLFFAICVEPGKNSLIMEFLPNGSLFKNLSESR